MTSTPEQLQEFKDWYISEQLRIFGRTVVNEFYNDKTWYELYDTYTAYANHVLTNHEGFQSNAELKRKLAALQEQNTNLLGKLATTEQNLAISQERVKELEKHLDTINVKLDDVAKKLRNIY